MQLSIFIIVSKEYKNSNTQCLCSAFMNGSKALKQAAKEKVKDKLKEKH